MKSMMARVAATVLSGLLLASCGASPPQAGGTASAVVSGTGHTVVGIQGTKFYLNGHITSPGKPAEGLLLNTRMAQAIFDDENPDTVGFWTYPDTKKWDPQRNTDEFVAMIPAYAHDGIRMITVGLQGGCPSSIPGHTCPSGDHDWVVSAFNADGSLKPAWMHRLDQVITAADHNGIVVMVQFFYHGQNQRLNSPDTTTAQKAAVNNITDWLVHGGYTNVLVETANECNAGYQPYTDCSNEANVIKQVQDRSTLDGHRLAAAVSYTGGGMPSDDVLAQEDFVLLHGNGIDGAALKNLINRVRNNTTYKGHPTPIVVNEDSTSIANMDASVGAGVSWGYLDTGSNNYRDGFQRPPVNWGINTQDKQAFFAEALKLAGPSQTSMLYRGPTAADYNDELTMTASLTDALGNALPAIDTSGQPRNVTFALDGTTCTGQVGATGDVACGVVPRLPGSRSLSISYPGDDQFQTVTQTVTVVVGPEQTTLVYHGDATFVNGTNGRLAAILTEDGTTPLAGRQIQFTIGSGSTAQTCTATTDVSGVAGCSPGSTDQPLGSQTASAAFAGDEFYAPATAASEVQVTAMTSGLSYTGPTSGDVNDPVTVKAVLASGDAPVVAKPIAFTLGTKSCVGHTDSQGLASCSITPVGTVGSQSLLVGFAGDQSLQPSSTTVTFVVGKEETRLSYTGDTSIRNQATAHLSAILTEDGDAGAPLSSRSISFTLGSGSSAQSCTAATTTTGTASCSIAGVNQFIGAGTVTATFAGDTTYLAAGDRPTTEVLAANPSTTPTATSTSATLATTGHPPSPSANPWGRIGIGALLLLAGLLLFVLPRRRPGEPAPLIWRNRE